MSIRLYGQLAMMPEKVEELRSVLKEIAKKYDLRKIEGWMNSPEYGVTENPFEQDGS